MAKPSAEDIRLKLEKQFKILSQIVKTAEGKEAVKYLEAKYSGDVLKPGDPYTTHARIGERRVVDFLKELQSEG